MNTDQFMPILLALIGSAGLWGFLSLRAKQNFDKALKDDARSAEFNVTLKEQVDRLSDKLDTVIKDKETLLREMSDMKAQLAEANATIKHLEEMLRSR
jgi:cell division septum initiation protein DivIVA